MRELLRTLQGAMSVYQFAKATGVSEGMLAYIYKGERRAGGKVLRCLILAYPERREELLAAFMAQPR